LFNYGILLIVVSRRLGHAKPSITLAIYGHLIPGTRAEEEEMIDEWVTPVKLHQSQEGVVHQAGFQV